MEPSVIKSRDLSLTDFYSVLQQEFISYYVRSKIYPPEYAKKYDNYCICKRDKIEKIGVKNCLPSIFNMESLKSKYVDSFLNAYGMPNFEYRDENSRRIMGKYDKDYWFSAGTSIKIKTDKSIVTSLVLRNLSLINKVEVKVEGDIRKFDYAFISRLISDGLFSF